METACFCVILFVMYITRCDGKKCIGKTESGGEKSVCCADYEAKHNDCIPCPEGYTSYAGQNCRQCPHNTYGDRCRYDCFCSVFEVCHFVDGCVQVKTTTGMLVNETSEQSTYKVAIGTTTIYTYTEHSTYTVQTSAIDEYEQLSRKLITYYSLAVTGMVFGIWLCFLFYKYKTGTIMTKALFINSTTPSLRQISQDIEMQGS